MPSRVQTPPEHLPCAESGGGTPEERDLEREVLPALTARRSCGWEIRLQARCPGRGTRAACLARPLPFLQPKAGAHCWSLLPAGRTRYETESIREADVAFQAAQSTAVLVWF